MTTTQKPGKTPPKKKPAQAAQQPPPKKSPPRRGPMSDPGMAPDPLDGFGMDGMDGAVAMSPVDTLAQWLMGTLDEGQVERLELQQTGPGGGGAPVKDWDSEALSSEEPDSLATDIYETACDDGATASRVSRYVVLAYRPGDAVHFRRHFFRVAPTDRDATFETEEPNAEGLVSQAHRAMEATLRLCLGSVGSTLRSLQIQNDTKDKALQEHTRIQLEVIRLQSELMKRTQEADLGVQERKFSLARKERISMAAESLLFSYVPLLIEKMGLPAPKQLTQPGGDPGGQTTRAAEDSGAGVEFSKDEMKLLHRVATHVLKLLAELDGAPFNLILARIPPDGHDDVRAIRDLVRSHAERNEGRVKNGEAPERWSLTSDQQKQLASFQHHVVQLLGAVSDMEMGMMLDRFPDNVRDDISKLRDIIRKQIIPEIKVVPNSDKK